MEIQFPIKIHVWIFFPYVWWIFVMVNVGKFIPYMDGLGLICWKECQTKCNYMRHAVKCLMKKTSMLQKVEQKKSALKVIIYSIFSAISTE